MCGITGYTGIDDPLLIARMMERLRHRGPDGEGSFREGGAALGHRRLSIIDLEGGAQPLYSEDESLVLVANGEIYNYKELRRELHGHGHRFATASDSEVVLHAFEQWGPEAFPRLFGMFACALYDRPRRTLWLVRDRIGIKPLYYLEQDGAFLFASELKAILAWKGYAPRLDADLVDAYLALRYVPGPGTLLRGIRKLPAGHYAEVRDGRATLAAWWKPELFAGPFEGSEADYLEELRQRLATSVQRRMIADVPVGAYLSGGVDSGVIVAAMAGLARQPVRTFSVGFDFEHDESAAAEAAARHLGCRHTSIRYTAADVARLPEIIWHLDEPVGDPIIIPMERLAAAASREVKVVLTGEGADEVLGGYAYHKALLQGARLRERVPRALLTGLLLPLLRATPSRLLDAAFDYPARLGRRGKQKVVDYLRVLADGDLNAALRHLLSLFDARDTGALYSEAFRAHLDPARAVPEPRLDEPAAAPLLSRIVHWHFAHWLQDDILTKQDKLSMAHGLEARVPFLDHELVEFLLKVPPALKIDGKTRKKLLRLHARELLPAPAADRPKLPFYVPFERCLAEPAFQALVEDTLSDAAVRRRGFFRPSAVAALRARLATGEFLYAKQVFSLVALELFCRQLIDARGAAPAPKAAAGA